MSHNNYKNEEETLYFPITPAHKVIVTKRYEVLYNLNDILLALLWLSGSICYLIDYDNIGTWIFIFGSFLFLLRPLIRILHKIQIKKR